MSIHKTVVAPWGCADLDALAVFLGAGADTNVGGRNRYHCNYVIYTDGIYYYAENGQTGNLVYGGPDGVGAVAGNDPTAVIQAVINASTGGGRIHIKNGEYAINTQTGLIFSGIENLIFRGSNNTVFKYTYAATVANPVIQMFSIEGACKNITIANIIFNMDEDSYSDAQRQVIAGLMWVGRATANSENILIDSCHFLNSPGIGLGGGAVDGWLISNCYFDNIGEHCIYFNGSTNCRVENCKILNWAKWIRGWAFKVAAASKNVYIRNIYGEPNEDGLGYLDSLGIGAEPMLLSVDGGCKNVFLQNAVCIGDAAITVRAVIFVQGSYNVIVDRLYAENWNDIGFINQDYDYFGALINSRFENMTCTGFPMLMHNCVFIDPPGIIVNAVDNSIISDTAFVRKTVVHDFILLDLGTGGDPVSNVLVKGCRFINWVYRGIAADNATDTIIRDCYFSGGYSSWAINCSGTRVSLLENVFDSDVTHGVNTISLTAGTDNVIVGNHIDVALSTAITPANALHIHRNIGYITENSGTATITAAATSIVVPHGCDYTPSALDVSVVLTNLPTNDIGDVHVDTFDAANFTINCRNVPGVATAIFNWNIRRTP